MEKYNVINKNNKDTVRLYSYTACLKCHSENSENKQIRQNDNKKNKNPDNYLSRNSFNFWNVSSLIACSISQA